MLESIRRLFDFATSGLAVSQELLRLVRARKGKSRLLLEELKENQDLCAMVVNEHTDPMKTVAALRTEHYDALLREGFDFGSLKKEKIRSRPVLQKSDLAPFAGKSTGVLVEDIYDKIKEIERRYRLDRDNPKTDWRRRMINVYKRIILLIDHLRD